jgi:hypothetical protein
MACHISVVIYLVECITRCQGTIWDDTRMYLRIRGGVGHTLHHKRNNNTYVVKILEAKEKVLPRYYPEYIRQQKTLNCVTSLELP